MGTQPETLVRENSFLQRFAAGHPFCETRSGGRQAFTTNAIVTH